MNKPQISFIGRAYDNGGSILPHVAFYTSSRAEARRWAARNFPLSSIGQQPDAHVMVGQQRMTVTEFLAAA